MQAALEKIDDLGEDDFKEAKQMIDLLKENVTNWKEEEENKNKPIDHVQWALHKLEITDSETDNLNFFH